MSLLVRLRAGAVEVVGLALWFFVFTRLHAAAGKDVGSATANAHSLQALEHALHLDIERTANRWLTEHPVFLQPAVYFYRAYYVVVLGVLVWAYLRHSDVYRHVRRTLVAMTALALPVFWALPMAPPRSALAGVVDIVFENDRVWGAATRDPTNGQNHISAMPSLHVAWSLWCAYAVWTALRGSHPRAALMAWAYPALMIAVVITTGNHYVLDVAGSVVLLALSLAVAYVMMRNAMPMAAVRRGALANAKAEGRAMTLLREWAAQTRPFDADKVCWTLWRLFDGQALQALDEATGNLADLAPLAPVTAEERVLQVLAVHLDTVETAFPILAGKCQIRSKSSVAWLFKQNNLKMPTTCVQRLKLADATVSPKTPFKAYSETDYDEEEWTQSQPTTRKRGRKRRG